MLFLDLYLDDAPVSSGQPCVSAVDLASGIDGSLAFAPVSGVTGSPTWEGLGSDFVLLFWDAEGSGPVQIPLQAIPAQRLAVVLGGQNVSMAVYQKDADEAQIILSPSTAYAESGYWDPDYSV